MSSRFEQLFESSPEGLSAEEASFRRQLAEALFRKASAEFLAEIGAQAQEGVTLGVLRALEAHRHGQIELRVFRPTVEEHGWSGPYAALEVVMEDRPFIVDSVRNELARRQLNPQVVLHPIYHLQRDEQGRLRRSLERVPASTRVVYELYLLPPLGEGAEAAELVEGIRRVLEDVVAATDDYPRMLAQVDRLDARIGELCAEAGGSSEVEDLREASEFLAWLKAGNFVFLGYREYDLVERPEGLCLRVDPVSGLGILRGVTGSSYSEPVPVSQIPENLRRRVLGGPLLLVTKSNAEATVHRRVRMDYIGIKKRDASGRVVGEQRLLGLFTTQAMASRVDQIPILRRKVQRVLELDDVVEGSHDDKQIRSIFDTLPLEELFWSNHEQLHRVIRTIMAVQQVDGVRLTLRSDPLGRGLLALVVMPRDRYTAEVRHEIQALLAERVGAVRVDYQLTLGEEENQARLHFFLTTEGAPPRIPIAQLEREITELTRTWEDRLVERLVEVRGEVQGRAWAARYAEGVSERYRASNPLPLVVRDLANLEALREESDPHGVDLVQAVEDAEGVPSSLLRIYRRGRARALSETMPILENFGIRVLDQASFSVARREGPGLEVERWGVDVFRVQDRAGAPLDVLCHRGVFLEAADKVLGGEVENHPLNQLVLTAALSIRQVALLRAYQAYASQLGGDSRASITRTLLQHPSCGRLLVEFFENRFEADPAEAGAASSEGGREARASDLRGRFLEALNAVSSLGEDRVLRALFNLMDSTVRTNYFQHRPYVSFKIRSADVLTMPEPRPLFEIMVSGPGVEGIHLRGGRVARGGLRWSDRPDDFRTEVLGLMKTQMVKNAVIVPEGAKGSFVLKGAPSGREALQAWFTEQYKVFIRGLLDLTDNLQGERIVSPEGLVIYDEPDPYLVVAADKGTASMSDVANQVAAEYGFWLGDAFASGGTRGYDHKKEAITARGAWECVGRHFRELGLNLRTDPFTVVGIGDMSGDVFGNGMLHTDRIRLVGAFNHLHIFLDPDPDPELAYQERQRLFKLPRSTWEDYDRARISSGGGVFLRAAKAIPLTHEVRALLGCEQESLSGEALIRALLSLPVDLLWNGGIGTYVRASSERDAEVGDSSNDPVRVCATELRCRVVGEGGNQGFTQLARIEYARQGGRINTDAIDNSAGVDMSDHEVNIKILLQPLLASGALSFEERNRLLEQMTPVVSRLVLQDNHSQSLCLSLAEQRSLEDLGLFQSQLDHLVQRGLNRRVEFLPDRKAFEERARAGQGLTRPELAVMLAYTKQGLFRLLLDTDFPEEPAFQHYLLDYFPPVLVERHADSIAGHRLKREILATQFTNKVVDLLGVTFVHRTLRDTGTDTVSVIRAALTALEILQVQPLLDRLHGLDDRAPAAVQYEAIHRLVGAVETTVNWMLVTRADLRDVSGYIRRLREPMAELRPRLEQVLPAGEGQVFQAQRALWLERGLEPGLAAEVAGLGYLPVALAIVEASFQARVPVLEAARRYFLVGERLSLGWLRDRLKGLGSRDKWEKIALVGLTMDLQEIQRELTLGWILEGSDPEDPEGYLQARGGLLDRYDQAFQELREREELGLAGGAVVARVLSQMAALERD